MPLATYSLEMAHVDKAREELLAELRPLLARAQPRIFGPDYMVALYDRSGKQTARGVYLPQGYIEDKVQGKIGLVVDIGPLCYGPEYEEWFGGEPPKVNDWVMTSIRDGLPFLLGNIQMRAVEWKYLRVSTLVPDLVA